MHSSLRRVIEPRLFDRLQFTVVTVRHPLQLQLSITHQAHIHGLDKQLAGTISMLVDDQKKNYSCI